MARAEKTKNRILEAARTEVLNQGFSATSIDAIQEAAGISRGTFFYHFPTKDALARALLERHAEEDRVLTDRFMARAMDLSSDPLQQALIFLALHEEMFREIDAGDVGCLFASFSYEAGLFDREAHEVVVGSIEHWREVLGSRFREAIERHGVRFETDPILLADLAYGVMQGAFILRRTLDQQNLMSDHIRQLRRQLELLFGQPSPADLPGAEVSARA